MTQTTKVDGKVESSGVVVRIEPRVIKDVLISGLDDDIVGDGSRKLMLDNVRAWIDGDGVNIEVVDGYRRLVGRLSPLEALELADLLLDYVLERVLEIGESAEKVLEKYEAELSKELKELERPKYVFTSKGVEAEVNHLTYLYRTIMNYEELLKAVNDIEGMIGNIYCLITKAYQILKYYG